MRLEPVENKVGSEGFSKKKRASVALMAREGLMLGRESGRSVPLGNATRAEAAVVLYRLYGLVMR